MILNILFFVFSLHKLILSNPIYQHPESSAADLDHASAELSREFRSCALNLNPTADEDGAHRRRFQKHDPEDTWIPSDHLASLSQLNGLSAGCHHSSDPPKTVCGVPAGGCDSDRDEEWVRECQLGDGSQCEEEVRLALFHELTSAFQSLTPRSEFSARVDEPPPSDEIKEDAGEEFMPGHVPQYSHLSTIFLLSGSALLVLGVLFYQYHAIVRHLLVTYVLNPVRFRVGEAKLVRWASEDFGVLMEGEEDVMVNESEEIEDELIPLRPIPARRSFFANYGSTRLG